MDARIPVPKTEDIPPFDRHFFESDNIVSRIGRGSIGGKASGLAFAARILAEQFPDGKFENLAVSIPRFVVIGTSVFDAFMERNNLDKVISGELSDERIGAAFQRADFPAEIAGDLRALIGSVTTPLALRSSSRLEDAMFEPFAGVYGTKMIPNNQPDTDTRYRKLIEGIKYVYASTFFAEARGYAALAGKSSAEEGMAVIVQEVVGRRYRERFYPTLAGVARSYNFYPVGRAKPEDGVVDLALGLGKSIVDGEQVWTYSPALPRVAPPFTTREMLQHCQRDFWAVNMGKPPAFDPVNETEFMVKSDLAAAEEDGTLSNVASTYVAANDRITLGTGQSGARVLNFAPLLQLGDIPVNRLIQRLLEACEEAVGAPVEIEFAASFDKSGKSGDHRFGFLQVRPMVVSTDKIDVDPAELTQPDIIVASETTLGNGTWEGLTDILYVRPDHFSKKHTCKIAEQINELNLKAREQGTGYVLIGFGRWGSSDPWLGIPVNWGHISGAKAIVEATLPDMNVDLSQGSHFFHNITSLQIPYFCVTFDREPGIDWSWLENQPAVAETEFVRHIRTDQPLRISVDGRSRRGIIKR